MIHHNDVKRGVLYNCNVHSCSHCICELNVILFKKSQILNNARPYPEGGGCSGIGVHYVVPVDATSSMVTYRTTNILWWALWLDIAGLTFQGCANSHVAPCHQKSVGASWRSCVCGNYFIGRHVRCSDGFTCAFKCNGPLYSINELTCHGWLNVYCMYITSVVTWMSVGVSVVEVHNIHYYALYTLVSS